MHDITLKNYTALGKNKNNKKSLLGGWISKSPTWSIVAQKSNYDTSRSVENSNTRGSPFFPPYNLNTVFLMQWNWNNGALKHSKEHFHWESNSIYSLCWCDLELTVWGWTSRAFKMLFRVLLCRPGADTDFIKDWKSEVAGGTSARQ